jgi:hypothetical protein
MNKISDLLKSVREGQTSLLVDQLRTATKDGNDRVKITFWGNYYGNGLLTAAAQVVPVDSNLYLVGITVGINSADGNTTYVSHYSTVEPMVKGASLSSIAITSSLFNPTVNGRDVIAFVSGMVQGDDGDPQRFYFEQKVTL